MIDAYHGTTTFYLPDRGNPIAATYRRIFPGLFRPIDEMPASIRAHVRYPEDLFATRGRDNLPAWLVARSDGEHYGRLRIFQFPKQKLVFGPRQVVARISQDQVIAPHVTLWSQQGSTVMRGTFMVIPIEESLIDVRPLYLRADAPAIIASGQLFTVCAADGFRSSAAAQPV